MHTPAHSKLHRAHNSRRNSPDALRRRRATSDAKREALAALLPPLPTGPEPLTLWQHFELALYVPTSGRCDQHAVLLNGQRIGLLSATQIAITLRKLIRNRPSVAVLADARRDIRAQIAI